MVNKTEKVWNLQKAFSLRISLKKIDDHFKLTILHFVTLNNSFTQTKVKLLILSSYIQNLVFVKINVGKYKCSFCILSNKTNKFKEAILNTIRL